MDRYRRLRRFLRQHGDPQSSERILRLSLFAVRGRIFGPALCRRSQILLRTRATASVRRRVASYRILLSSMSNSQDRSRFLFAAFHRCTQAHATPSRHHPRQAKARIAAAGGTKQYNVELYRLCETIAKAFPHCCSGERLPSQLALRDWHARNRLPSPSFF